MGGRMKAVVELHLAKRDGCMPVAVRLELAAAVTPDAPLRRCADCALDLGPVPALAAAFACPLFGEPRSGVEIRCRQFQPRRPA